MKTDYCAVLCDDDFLFPVGASKAIAFLEDNKEHVAILGQEAALNDLPCQIAYDMLNYRLKTTIQKPSISSDPKERILDACNFFDGLWVHALTRTEIYKDLIKAHLSWPKELTNLKFYDKTHVMYLANKGKLGYVKDLFIIRSNEYLSHGQRFSDQEKLYKEEAEAHYKMAKNKKSFKKDFLKLDLEPVENELGVDRKFLKSLHKTICDEKIKFQAYKRLVENNDMLVEYQFTSENGKEVIGSNALIFRVNDFPLTFSITPTLGPGADFEGAFWVENDEDLLMKGRFGNLCHCVEALSKLGNCNIMKTHDDWESVSNIYPIYKKYNRFLLEQMLLRVIAYPIGNLVKVHEVAWNFRLAEEGEVWDRLEEAEMGMFFNNMTVHDFLAWGCNYPPYDERFMEHKDSITAE